MERLKYKENDYVYMIFISVISERLRELALERYLEWREYSSAGDKVGPPMSPNPRILKQFHPLCDWADFSHSSSRLSSGSLMGDMKAGSRYESKYDEFLKDCMIYTCQSRREYDMCRVTVNIIQGYTTTFLSCQHYWQKHQLGLEEALKVPFLAKVLFVFYVHL